MVLTELDQFNLREIKEFLDSLDVPYDYDVNEPTIFTFFKDNPDKKTYIISYIPAAQFPVFNKKYCPHGVPGDYFCKKSQEAEANNSFICWVKDYEWNDVNNVNGTNQRKREVLKSYWTYAVGKIKNSFFARDCEVKEVPSREARQFESEHCFYGKRGATLSLGLYTKKEKHGIPPGELIMIYTFGFNFFGKCEDIEVLRVGTRKFCNVAGGASKLLNHFVQNYKTLKVGKKIVDVRRIVFYSDYDHNAGSSMGALLFEYSHHSNGGFMNLWTETNQLKSREPVRHKWVMEQMGLGRVVSVANAGVKTFFMKVNEDFDFEKYRSESAKDSDCNVCSGVELDTW